MAQTPIKDILANADKPEKDPLNVIEEAAHECGKQALENVKLTPKQDAAFPIKTSEAATLEDIEKMVATMLPALRESRLEEKLTKELHVQEEVAQKLLTMAGEIQSLQKSNDENIAALVVAIDKLKGAVVSCDTTKLEI